MTGRQFVAKVRHEMFVAEMIDDLSDQSKKKILAKMVENIACMAHWLADSADPTIKITSAQHLSNNCKT